MKEEFVKWYTKRINKLGIPYSLLMAAPKFDGSAINIIYKADSKKDLVLFNILTRHDESYGKDVTSQLKDLVPNQIYDEVPNVKENSILEIRCEVVIDKDVFEYKYSNKYENPRNFVSGILHTDDIDLNICHDLVLKPVHFILDGIHLPPSWFKNESFNMDKCNENIYETFLSDNYEAIVEKYIELRDMNEYQLDGIVISFPIEYRHMLGENEHDPEWSIAIKFIPEEVVTSVNDVKWYVGKTGELTPVLILEPVRLAGTTVKRASGYNAGYVINNQIGPGAIVSVAKAGDIIPEVQEIKSASPLVFKVPENCPSCDSPLTMDGIHLMCTNEECGGKIGKRLLSSFRKLKLKGIGPATLQLFVADFMNLADLIYWVRKNGGTKEIEKYGFKYGSRSHEIFMNVFNGIESITYDQVILMLGLDNVGKSLAKEVSNYHNDVEYSWAGHDRSLVAMLNSEDIRTTILDKICILNACGITVVRPGTKTNINKNVMKKTINVCLTGSPKPKWTTKEEFKEEFDNINECSITDKDCDYLITNSLDSKTSKMDNATKRGIPIITYIEFYESNK